MSDKNLFTYNALESSKKVIATESKKDAIVLSVDNQKNKGVTITSLEIAELTGKRHDIVIRDIETILGRVVGVHRFVDTYQNPQNKQFYKCYQLPKREALILVSGYSVELRAKIIDRLEHLENQLKSSTQKLPQTYAEALRELADRVCQTTLLYS